jgi:hypothetical protein
MPRRNSKPRKHVPFRIVNNEAAKRRYPSEFEAKKAAEERMLLFPSLELTVYQGADRGWYLTRAKSI